jgi:AcrR family transcriptional regulator
MNDKTTRTLLINSARTLFLEKGFDRTPVEEICELAGMAKGTFFYHFETKQYLVKYLLDMQFRDMMEQAARAMEECGNPAEKLRSFMVMLISTDVLPPESAHYFKKQPEWFYKLYDDARYATFYPLIADILNEGCEEGLFHVRSAETAASLLLFGINGFLHCNCDRMENDDKFRKEALCGVDELISRALGYKAGVFRLHQI